MTGFLARHWLQCRAYVTNVAINFRGGYNAFPTIGTHVKKEILSLIVQHTAPASCVPRVNRVERKAIWTEEQVEQMGLSDPWNMAA
jgi:hypothetical protein